MAGILKVVGVMDVFITVSSEKDMRTLTREEEAEILLAVEHALNSQPPIKNNDYSLNLRVHIKEK